MTDARRAAPLAASARHRRVAGRIVARCVISVALSVAALYVCSSWLFVGFLSVEGKTHPWPRVSRRTIAEKPHGQACAKSSLEPGDVVVVGGAVGATGQIVVSMLKSSGYIPRPLINQGMGNLPIFDDDVEAYVVGGGEPLPAAAGLVIADEVGLQGNLIAGFVRQLSKIGPLTRVALLTGKKPGNPVMKFLQGGAEAEAKRATEVATRTACADAGVACSVIQTGELRGGGHASGSPHCLGPTYYQQVFDSVQSLEEELYDTQQKGFRFGAVDGGPFDSPQTSRLIAAAALVECLGVPAAANRTVGVVSVEAKEWPTKDQWLTAFMGLS
mmetsp:Transcript_74531/g.207082  ORF Transcript_74531/g.207082 Transcript_74531/m.207082 type:complete len:329 (-) Transcript_74531:18-1004(-)